MKVVPHATAPMSGQQSQSQQGQSSRDRAVAAFMGSNSPQGHVQDQNSVSVEEIAQSTAPEAMPIPEPQLQETTPEVVATEPKTAPQPDALSKQYAELARKERQMRQKFTQEQQLLKAEKDAWALEKQTYEQKVQQYEQGWMPKDRLKQSTLEVLAEQGISYDEITQQILNQQPVNPQVQAKISSLEQIIQKLEAKLDQGQKSAQAQQQQAYQSAIKQLHSDANALVKTDPAFEMIKATNSVKDVVDLIVKTHEQDGILLSVEDAAAEVESYLEEEAIKLANLKKIQGKLKAVQPQSQPKPEVPQTQQVQKSQQTQPTMRTLTNAQSASRPLSARERAIAAFNGTKIS